MERKNGSVRNYRYGNGLDGFYLCIERINEDLEAAAATERSRSA